MKVWVTKYALPGQVWIDEQASVIGTSSHVSLPDHKGMTIVSSRHMPTSPEAAVAKIESDRKKRIASLRKQIDRLEAIDIPALVASAPVVRKAGE